MKLTFFLVNKKPVLLQNFQYLSYSLYVILVWIFGIDKNII